MTQMNTDAEKALRINAITEKVIGCAFKVGNALGPGFLEKVYENALIHELRKAGLKAEPQFRITVWYDSVQIGEYVADILVQDLVLVELKAVRVFDDSHTAQCINCLAATKLPICLLLNFSKRVEVKRIAGQSFPASSHLCSSVSSVASAPASCSSSAPTPATYAEQAQWDDP